MMVVILTPVDGIIRWLPRGFSCSRIPERNGAAATPPVKGSRGGRVIPGRTAVPAEHAKDAFDFVKQFVIGEIQCRPGTGHAALLE